MNGILSRTLAVLTLGTALAVMPLATVPTRADDLEATYWMMISDRTDAEAFENYLKRFPNGEHAFEALARLQQINGTSGDTAPAAVDPPSAADPAPASDASSATPAQADPDGSTSARMAEALFENALTAYHLGNKERAFALYAQSAEAGWADAHFQMALMLDQGDGVPLDSLAAINHFVAAGRLGVMDGYRNAILVQSYERSTVFNPLAAARLMLEYAGADPVGAVDMLDNLGPETLIPLQTDLASAGYYTFAIDGQTGPGTRAALEAYGRDMRPSSSVVATEGSAPPLVVHHAGVGALTASTPFDADALRQALPGFTIKANRISIEGMSEIRYQVLSGDELMLSITGEQVIYAIDAYGTGIADKAGMTIGHSRFADYQGSVEDNCWVMEEEGGGSVGCYGADPAVTYFFGIDTPVYPDTDGILHRASVPSAARLERMLWYPTE